MKKGFAIFLFALMSLAVLQSCGNHCDCPSFGKKKPHSKQRR